MSLTEFIYQELTEDGTLDPDTCDATDITRDFLMQEADYSDAEIDDLTGQYHEYCANEGIYPYDDLED